MNIKLLKVERINPETMRIEILAESGIKYKLDSKIEDDITQLYIWSVDKLWHSEEMWKEIE